MGIHSWRQTAEDDQGFVDPDTYTLFLTLATRKTGGTVNRDPCDRGSDNCLASDDPSQGNNLDIHPKVVLGTYRGWKESLDAPDWTRRKPGRELVFRQTKAELVEFLARVASARINVKVSA